MVLPNEISFDITNFLPNDDITDLMIMSRNFNALVTPRLKKIDEEMSSMNQSIQSFMPSPAPDPTDHEWISQLNLKRFEPIGTVAKKRMKKLFENPEEIRDCMDRIHLSVERSTLLPRLKEKMSLERFDDPTFLRILGALLAQPEFRQEYNVSLSSANFVRLKYVQIRNHRTLKYIQLHNFGTYDDVLRIFSFHNFYDLAEYNSGHLLR